MNRYNIFSCFRIVKIVSLLFLLSIESAKSQEFQFTPDLFHQIFYSSTMSTIGYNTNIAGVSDDRWSDMLAAQTSWPSLFKFKSVSNIIKVGIDHSNATIVQNYKYRVSLEIHGYNNPTSPSSYETKYAQIVIEYNKDSLQSYNDLVSYKIDGAYHKLDVFITNISDISSNPTNTAQLTTSLVATNFYIETSILSQAYDKENYTLFVSSGYDATNEGLNVNFGYLSPGTTIPACGSGILPSFARYEPVKYELEWTYVDDYKINDFKNLSSSYGYKNTVSTFSVPYNFKHNATRIQTYDHSFKIPIIYEHGAIVFRVRTVRPDSLNYSQLVYSNWDLPDTGTLANASFNSSNSSSPYKCIEECLYLNNTTTFANDKFDWQYAIQFAEEGKYKNTLNYFDGAGHNRQTQSKINTDLQYIVASDHIYDYEGRPGIHTLPTPILGQTLDFKPNLSYKMGSTTTAYSAGDFDKGCLSDSIYGFDPTNSLIARYFSPNNPDKTGMQAYVPDAEGYPFIETIYSPDNTNKVIWQGGAGYNFQHFKKHGTTTTYVRADQYELDKLFGSQSGRSEYYPKVIKKDQNNQLSYSIYNQKGKIIATALLGKSDTAAPIVNLDNLSDSGTVTLDILANNTQDITGGSRFMNYTFFPDAAGANSLKYHGSIAPYFTGCTNKYINVQGNFNIKVVDECGAVQYADSGVAGVSNVATTNAGQAFSDGSVPNFNLTPDKFTIVKQLYFPDTAIYNSAVAFVNSNTSGPNLCYDYQDDFVMRSVDSATFPCVKATDTDVCDILKKSMMAELYPGAKYGGYTKTPSGTFASGLPNSIFSLVDSNGLTPTVSDSFMYIRYGHFAPPEGGVLLCNDAPPNYGNPDSLIYIGTVDTVYTNSATPPSSYPYCDWQYDFVGPIGLPSGAVKFRYQFNCTVLPSITWQSNNHNGLNIFGPANGAPPDALIANFNDNMAQALLPFHPEYCKLLLCDDHIEDILKTITTYEQAQALGLETLTKIERSDKIVNTTANPMAPLDTTLMVRYPGTLGNSLTNRLDSLALEQAYCGCEGAEAYSYCKSSEYAYQIKNFVMADTTIQNTYIRRLISNYIANRELRIQQRMGTNASSCGPCQSERMTLTGTPDFPVAIDPSGNISDSLHLPTALKNILNQALAGTTFSGVPSYVTTAANGTINSNILQQALNIMSSLQNCTFPNLVPVTPTDSTLIVGDLTNTANCGADGKSLTPDIVKTILTNRGVTLNELCNPYLIDYSVYNQKAPQVNTPFVDKGADFYTGMQTFINRTEVMKALTQASSGGATPQPISLATSPSVNRFESDYATVLGYVSGHTLTLTGYTKTVTEGSTTRNYIAILFYDATSGIKDTLFFTQRLVNAPPLPCSGALPSSPIVGQTYTALSFSNLHSIFHDPNVSAISDGLNADNLVFATLTSTAVGTKCGHFLIWSHTLPMLKRADPQAIDGCINCVQINNAVQAYFTNAATYSMPTFVNDPTFPTDLTNYLNYNLGKTHTYDDYERLMKGCALSDKVAFKQSLGQYKLSFASELDASTGIAALNNSIGNANISYFSYKTSSGSVIAWFDLNSVSKDKYLTAKNLLLASPAYLAYDDVIANALVSVLVPTSSCLPTWTANAPVGTTVNSTAVSVQDMTGAYTLPYTLYSLVNTGSNTEKSIADLISSISNSFNSTITPCASGIVLPSRKLMRSSDYSNTVKQSYLTYVYGLGSSGYSQSIISDSLAPSKVQTALGLTAYDLISYYNPWCPNTKESLFYGKTPTVSPVNAQWNIFNNAIAAITANTSYGLNGKLFLSPTGNPVKNLAFSSGGTPIKAILMSNGWMNYQYDLNNTFQNFYLIPAPGMIDSANAYTYVSGSLKPVIEGDSFRWFSVSMQQTFSNGLPTHTVTCYGYSDFAFGKGAAIQNVVLYDNNGNPGCIDTLTCERQTFLTARQQGIRQFGAYADSITQFHYQVMRNYFPANTVDTLDLKTIKQQYQYTLYYYDLAGNLNKSVSPAGVNPMSDISQVDVARNSNVSSTNQSLSTAYVPVHTKVSEYHYNSTDQLIWQVTPDGDTSKFFYDDARRQVFSQNAQQRADSKYSYTLYDGLGRIYETGAVAFSPSEYSGTNQDPDLVHDAQVSDMSYLIAELKLKAKEDVVATFYDEPLLNLDSYAGMSAQENLRKRISSVLYKPQLASSDSIQNYYAYATHFSYDALGNVKTLVQDNPYMDYLGQRFKRIDYDYDLLSGKVNMVSYNRGKPDQFYQKYSYDADNRIITAQSSNDGMIWDQDAAYDYYRNGALAKATIGNQGIQSIQYAYTIQGWLKAINGDVLDTTVDMGKDGGSGLFPQDVMANALAYHNNDYKAIGGTSPVATDATVTLNKSLYDGNIARQTTAVNGLDNLQKNYKYDQVGRLKKTDYAKIDNLTHAVVSMATAAFANSYSYDPDGNIKTLIRYSDAGAPMDSLTYHYKSPGNNLLDNVMDGIVTSGGNDFKSGQTTGNFQYDKIGNLIHDNSGHIDSVFWNLYGKVSDMDMSDSGNYHIHYDYDGLGNRVRKDVFSSVGGVNMRTSDLYVWDLRGNIMAVYKGKSKIEDGYTIEWINNDIITQHGGWVTPTNQGLIPFLIAQFGNNGQFITPLIHNGESLNPSWGNEQSVSLSLNQFLTLSDPIFLQATQEPFSDYFGPMVTANTGLMTATLIGDGSSSPFLALFNGLLNDSKQLTPTLTHLTSDATDLTQAIMTDMSLTYSGNAARDASVLSAYVSGRGASALLSSYGRYVTSYSVNHFYTGLVTDNKILNQTWFQGQPDVSAILSDAVFNYAPRSDASSFFNDYLPTIDPDWLTNNTSMDDRLNVVYQNDQPTFMNNYLSDVGITGVNTALQAIPQLTVSGYVHAVWEGVLHGTLNPTYVPPDVNTPSPDSMLVADTIYLAEHHLYGNKRLGIKSYDSASVRSVYVGMNSATNTPAYIADSTLNIPTSWLDGGFQDWIKKGQTATYTSGTFNLSTDTLWEYHKLGSKEYELTDHLDNVLAVVLDKKTGYGNLSGLYKGYYANLASISDYYPFGMLMPNRNKSFEDFKFGYNDQLKTNEVYGKGNLNTAKFWELDTRLGRRWNRDIATSKHPDFSPYMAWSNNPIHNVDPNGDDNFYLNQNGVCVAKVKTTSSDDVFFIIHDNLTVQQIHTYDRNGLIPDSKGRLGSAWARLTDKMKVRTVNNAYFEHTGSSSTYLGGLRPGNVNEYGVGDLDRHQLEGYAKSPTFNGTTMTGTSAPESGNQSTTIDKINAGTPPGSIISVQAGWDVNPTNDNLNARLMPTLSPPLPTPAENAPAVPLAPGTLFTPFSSTPQIIPERTSNDPNLGRTEISDTFVRPDGTLVPADKTRTSTPVK